MPEWIYQDIIIKQYQEHKIWYFFNENWMKIWSTLGDNKRIFYISRSFFLV